MVIALLWNHDRILLWIICTWAFYYTEDSLLLLYLLICYICAHIFITATSQRWSPRINLYSQTGEQVRKLWYTHSVEYYLALKAMEGLTNAVSWEHSTKERQSQNEIKCCIELLMWSAENSRNHRDRRQDDIFQGLKVFGEWKMLFNGYKVSLWKNE